MRRSSFRVVITDEDDHVIIKVESRVLKIALWEALRLKKYAAVLAGDYEK